MPSYALRHPNSGPGCEIELGQGLTYSIAARGPEDIEWLLEQLLDLPGAQVADSVGGLVNNINILENIALPALYHRLATIAETEKGILDAFAACGLEGAQAQSLLGKWPGELTPLEKRMAGFVRSLLSRPQVLVYSRFFEGLTKAEMTRAAGLNAVYRERRPDGTAIYLMLRDMPDLQPDCHQRIEIDG